MPRRDIVVIGASAGGVEALQHLVRHLPADFPGSIFVVLHISPRAKSFLPHLLSKSGPLPAEHPADGESIQPGRIYVAPPDHHLVIERGHVHLSMGPKEQHHRPCINVMFRSAALAYGDRVAAVVLTGELDDGTAGLWEVSRRGGVTVIQNPETASFPSMPLSALREMPANHIANVRDMGDLLTRLATDGVDENHKDVQEDPMTPRLTDLTCPDCRGTLWEIKRGDKGREFRCRVGHTFSTMSMLSGHFAVEEKTLYQAIVALEEGASLANRLADDSNGGMQERLRQEASDREAEAENLRRLLSNRTTFTLD